MPTTVSGSYPAVNSDSDATINGLTVGKGGGASFYNTAVGAGVLAANTTGIINTAVGSTNGANATLSSNTTGNGNNAFGAAALGKNTTASQNNAFGYEALRENTTGANNVAIGGGALLANTTASGNTAVGYQAGYATTTTSNAVSAFGYQAMLSNTTGTGTAVGSNAYRSNTTGTAGVAVGLNALYNNTTGGSNTAVGQEALVSNTTASDNTAVGYQALYTNATGTAVTALGYKAGYASTGSVSVYVGFNCGVAATGSSNTFIGSGAGEAVTSGAKNTIVGRYNGNQGGLDIRTSSNYIVLSDGDGNPRAQWDNNGGGRTVASYQDFYAWGAINSTATRPFGIWSRFSGASPNNTTQSFLDCEDTTNVKAQIYSSGAYGSRPNSYGGLSDVKLKQDIVDASSQWNDIKSIKVRKFRFKDDPNSPLQIGVVAQEIEQTSAGLVYESNDYTTNEAGEKVETGEVTKSVKYSILYMKAIKALQEAMERIETLEAKVTALENK